jgi:hypothetical protein
LALPWVKLHTSLIDNDAFLRLSSGSRLTFLVSIAIAGKQEQDGKLAIRGVGAMTVDEIARYTGLQQKQQAEALDNLVRVGFLSYNSADFMYAVERWDEKAGSESARMSHAERQRRYRDRKRDASDIRDASRVETNVTQNVTDIDKDTDKDKDSVTLRVPGLAAVPGKGPSERDLAAYAIIDALYPVVNAKHDLRKTHKLWKTHNKNAALGLVDTGTTPEEAVAMLQVAYENPRARQYYGGIVTIAKLAEHWAALVKMTRPQELTPEQIADAKMRGYFMPGGGGEEAYRHDCGVSA